MLEIYLILVIVTLILAGLAMNPVIQRKAEDKVWPNKLFVGLITSMYCVVSGVRYLNYYLGDEWNYRLGFNSFVDMKISQVFSAPWEIGFNLLTWVLAQITNDNQILIFVTGIVTNIIIIQIIAKYTKPFELGIFLYLSTGMFFTSFNIIRQYLALAILLCGIKHLLKKDFKRYLVYILIAASVHKSFLLMIPIYFLVTYKKFFKLLPLILVGTLVFLIAFEDIMRFILQGGEYSHYVKNIGEVHGVGVIRVLVICIPVIMMVIWRKKLIKIDYNNEIMINLLIVGACIMVISTQYVFFARLEVLVGIYNLMMIPQLTRIFRSKRDNMIMYVGILVLYFIYGLYGAGISVPYKTIFTQM